MKDDKHIQDAAFTKLEADLIRLGKSVVPPQTMLAESKKALFHKIEEKQKNTTPHWIVVFFDRFMRRGLQVAFSVFLIVGTASLYFLIGLQPSEAAFIGQLNVTEGKAFILRAANIIEVTSHEKLLVGDQVEVPKDTKAEMHFIDHTKTALSSETNIVIKDFEGNSSIKKEYVKRIELSRGEVKESTTSTLAVDAGRVTTIETPTGVVEAAPNATFIVSVDDKTKQASVIVTEKQVAVKDLPPSGAGTENSNMTENEKTVALISQGETATMQLAEGLGNTKVQVEGVSLLANTTERSVLKKDPFLNTTIEKNKEKIIAKGEDTTIILPVPEMDFAETKAIDNIIVSADIAQVKLLHVLEVVQGEQNDSILLMTIRGYYQTLGSITSEIDSIRPGSTSLGGTYAIAKPSDFMTTSPLTALVHAFATQRTIIQKGSLTRYETALGKLSKLQTIESSIAIKIRLQHLNDEQGNTNRNGDVSSSISNLQSLKGDLPFEQKRAIGAVIDSELVKKLDAVETLKDSKEKTKKFVEYLETIPNTKANYALLDNLYKKSPDELKGYVKLKMHHIMYSAS